MTSPPTGWCWPTCCSRWGLSVVEAEDGRQAIELAQRPRPDLILMDRHMPVLDGLEAVQQIRSFPALPGCRLSDLGQRVGEDQALSRRPGYDAFLPKPIVWPRLAALLEHTWSWTGTYAEAGDEPTAPPQLEDRWSRHQGEELAVLYELARQGICGRSRSRRCN